MRYFHRTSMSPDDVLENAESNLGSVGTVAESGARNRVFKGAVGQISLHVEPEGGHYTRVTIDTDQEYKGEVDKVVQGFLKALHSKAHEV